MSAAHGLTKEPRELVGKLTVSMPSGGGDGDKYVSITLTDELSFTEFLDLRISLENFARVLCGQGFIPCLFEHRPGKVGMVAKHKTELVPYVNHYDDAGKEQMRANMRVFEVDGWVGCESDLFNHHDHVAGTQGGDGFQRVGFRRYVPVTSDDATANVGEV